MSIIMAGFLYVWDKIVLILSFSEKLDELKSYRNGDRFCKKNLSGVDYKEKIETIWETLFKENVIEFDSHCIEKIYSVNHSIFDDNVLAKMDFYICNRLWSLLNFFEIDTWGWDDKDIFGRPSLIVYAIIAKNKSALVIITSLQEQKFKLIKDYSFDHFPVWKFRRRQLVFDKTKGYLSI